MELTQEQQKALDKAFEEALRHEGLCGKTTIELDGGVDKLLPHLLESSLNTETVNYQGEAFNQYEIIEKIGSGGMGDVYLAKRNDGHYEKNVAIKVLNNAYNDDGVRLRFLREKQILAGLRHPGIVPLLDAGLTDDNIPWFVLEFIDGEPIHKFSEKYNLSREEIIKLMLKVCDAIHFAHTKGVIHRDIKPANILVETIDGKFNPIILDFGIAQRKDQANLTRQGNIMGTPNYMSPEQIKGDIQQLDRRSDVFSLGVVLYRLLTGVQPFKGSSTVETYQKILNDQPNKANKFRTGFPKDLQIILETCLQKKSAERYQSIFDLKQDLENWLNGYPIAAKKERFVTRASRLVRRNKLATIVITAVLLLSFLSFAKYTYDIKMERHLAMESKAEADALLNFLIEDLNSELKVIGRLDLLETVAEKSLEHLDNYQGVLDPEQSLQKARSYQNIADILELKGGAEHAEPVLYKGREILFNLLDDPQYKQQALHVLIGIQIKIGNLHTEFDVNDQALADYRIAETYVNDLNPHETIEENIDTKWNFFRSFSWYFLYNEDIELAEENTHKFMDVLNQGMVSSKGSKKWMARKIDSLDHLVWLYILQKDHVNSIKVSMEIVDLSEEMVHRWPDSLPYMDDLISSYNGLADALYGAGDYQAIIDNIEKAIELGKLVHIKAPDNYLYHWAWSKSYSHLGSAYKELGDYEKAKENYIEALAVLKEWAVDSAQDGFLQETLADYGLSLGNVLFLLGEVKLAEKYWAVAESGISIFATQSSASISHIRTYVKLLLVQGKQQQAQAHLTRLKENGMKDDQYQALIKEFTAYKAEQRNSSQ